MRVCLMAAQGTPFYQSIPGLWYDRRRDEHAAVSRTGGNVWGAVLRDAWDRNWRPARSMT